MSCFFKRGLKVCCLPGDTIHHPATKSFGCPLPPLLKGHFFSRPVGNPNYPGTQSFYSCLDWMQIPTPTHGTNPASRPSMISWRSLVFWCVNPNFLITEPSWDFNFFFISVSWLVLSEIFPGGIRGRAIALTSCVNWGVNLLISSTFLTITGKAGRAYHEFIWLWVSVMNFSCTYINDL